MRQPTSPDTAWAWWESAVAGAPTPLGDGPQVGFYRVRKWFRWHGERVHWSRNEWVPARIWIEPGEIDHETGELLSDEKYRMEIDGRREDPWKAVGSGHAYEFLLSHPITEEEYQWLTALSPLLPSSPRPQPKK